SRLSSATSVQELTRPAARSASSATATRPATHRTIVVRTARTCFILMLPGCRTCRRRGYQVPHTASIRRTEAGSPAYGISWRADRPITRKGSSDERADDASRSPCAASPDLPGVAGRDREDRLGRPDVAHP